MTTAMPAAGALLPPRAREDVDLLVEVLNESYPDAMAFVAGRASGQAVRNARICRVDRGGVEFAVEGRRTLRLAFDDPVTDADAFRAGLRAQLSAARAAAPGAPPTSLERAYDDVVRQQSYRCTVRRIVDDIAPAVPVHVVAEVDDDRYAIDLPGGPRTTVTWVFRDGDEPGTGTRLLDAVRGLDLDPEGLFAFGAAEAGCIMPVRRHLRRAVGLDRDHVRMGGYWRRAP